MTLQKTENINYTWAGLIIEELVRNGITRFCIAPGSRSSALAASAARHPAAETTVHFDERGLAFFALGYAAAVGNPAVLICSSGTAVANFFPGVIETSKKKLPMLLLTADRPPELQDTGALQTVDQVKIYGSYVRWYTCLPPPDRAVSPQTILTTVDQALARAAGPMAGPVHINCMFREPLAPDPDQGPFDAAAYLAPVRDWLTGSRPYTRYETVHSYPQVSSGSEVTGILDGTKRGVIVVGKTRGEEDRQAILQLAETLGWPIFPDGVSGLRNFSHPHIVHYFDQVLLSDSLTRAYPVDTVLHLGGRITSKRWYAYIEKQRPQNYITVLGHILRNDPLHRVTLRIHSSIHDFVQALLPLLKPREKGDHLEAFCRASREVDGEIDRFLERRDEIDEITVARHVSAALPADHGLFLANSMPVREVDMYAPVSGTVRAVGGNRGASGIDGVVASACGFCLGLERPVTLLIGDLSCLHDLNSLALVAGLKKPLTMVVVNNDGGGIFSFLPIARSPAAADLFEPYFAVPHGFDFSCAAEMFGLDYYAPRDKATFKDAFDTAVQSERSTIIEVKTRRRDNYELHRDLQDVIRQKLDKIYDQAQPKGV